MSNKKKNYFNPGRLEKKKGQKISQFPQGKKSQNPNSILSFNIKKQKSFVGVKPIVNKQSQIYKKNGKPLKPNTGSLDRLQKIKAQNATRSK
jgi:hypothetical protein